MLDKKLVADKVLDYNDASRDNLEPMYHFWHILFLTGDKWIPCTHATLHHSLNKLDVAQAWKGAKMGEVEALVFSVNYLGLQTVTQFNTGQDYTNAKVLKTPQ